MRDLLRKLLVKKSSKVAVFLLCLVPLEYLGLRAYHGELTANPVEFVQHFTGDWTLRFLLITLSVTPLRKLLNVPELIRFRRMLGLFAFTYVSLHFLTYIGPDQSFDLGGMWKDVVKRPFVTVGFLGFVLLIPLALTSTALCGVIHYYWLVKSDHRLPLLYGAILAVLLLYRLVDSLLKPRPAVSVSPAS